MYTKVQFSEGVMWLEVRFRTKRQLQRVDIRQSKFLGFWAIIRDD